MISHQYRFIHFHIPRSAGSTIKDALWRYRDNNKNGPHPKDHPDFYGEYDWHLYGFNTDKEFDKRPIEKIEYEGKVVGEAERHNEVSGSINHMGNDFYDYVTHFLAEASTPYSHTYGKEKFNEYYKFAFVRNPWDRFVSLWFKFKQEKKLQENFNNLYGLNFDSEFTEMEEVLRFLWLADKKGMLLPRWFKPQYEYIHLSNLRLLINYVGVYEKLQFCFDFLCDRIDFPHCKLPWSEDKHRRKEKDKKHYSEFYVPRTRDMIADIYREDLRTWRFYEFEG